MDKVRLSVEVKKKKVGPGLVYSVILVQMLNVFYLLCITLMQGTVQYQSLSAVKEEEIKNKN